jgi:hypothetical protein
MAEPDQGVKPPHAGPGAVGIVVRQGAHSWMARSASQAACRVRHQSMPKHILISPTKAMSA